MKKSVLSVSGMGCSGCANSVESALTKLDGVESVVVNLGEGTATVSFDESRVQPSDLEQAIEDAGYKMTGVKA